MTLPVELTTEIQKLAPSAIVELFILDATSLGGTVHRFHAGTNELKQNVVWQGNTYVRYPVEITGFEFNGQGQFPRPKLRVANILSAITEITMSYNDLIGAKVTRKRTMAKFLDAVNFEGSVNPTADSTAEFAEDIYYIDRKSNEDKEMVEFELAASVDLAGVFLPRRQVIQNVCTWKYRDAECSYAGAPLFDANDDRILTASTAEGQAVIDAYTAVLAAEATLASAETALTAAAQAMGPSCEYQRDSRSYNDNGWQPGQTPAFTNGVANIGGTVTAFSSSVQVSLGAQYRIGPLQKSGNYSNSAGQLITYETYSIEIWALDSAGCTTATNTYNSAVTTRDNAISALATANTDLDTALTALPADDPLYTLDVCGKRLTSCKARFGENNELPFGSFPAAGLIK